VTRLTAECADHCQRRRCSSEQAAKEALLCGYDRTSRPVINDSTQIRVHIAVALFHILDTDEKHQTFSALMSIRLRWTDEYLTWDPEDFNGTTNLHIPSSAIWTPDIVISNR
uniref:Neur_chan_LBD domain-containing protein n=1 Tax=Macrostomum lignano TaxID=282301 RepID=A0A1I8GIH3_9PLAT